MKKLITLLFLSVTITLYSQMGNKQDSGGPLLPEQAAYDVTYYALDLNIDPSQKFISGSNLVEAKQLAPINLFILQLDSVYTVHKVEINGVQVNYIQENGLLKADLSKTNHKVGGMIKAKVYYEGNPPIAENAPWDEGFIWSKTKSGADWIGVTCEGGGGDVWWPCKDHPSDEPDSVSLSFTVPSGLICASNGKLISTKDNGDGTTTYNWFVSTPINNYCVTLNIAPYKVIHRTFKSIAGDPFPIEFYVLPESYDTAKVFTDEFLDDLKFYEKYCGPYPFRADKYGIAESPYLGMEHQTIIAYGNGYKNNSFGFDWLHHHELSHEWWGNLVTAKDWSDIWIHEGIGTYMQALYAEDLQGKDGLIAYMQNIHRFMNNAPIKQKAPKTAGESYLPDVYNKAAWTVHTLRYFLGDSTFFTILRRWAYPDPKLEKVTDGSQCRLATTQDMIDIAENISGQDLDWIFDVLLKQAKLPKLEAAFIEKNNEGELRLRWNIKNDLPYPMPVEVKIGSKIKKIEMKNGEAVVKLPPGIVPVVDPNAWLTMAKFKMEKYSKKGF